MSAMVETPAIDVAALIPDGIEPVEMYRVWYWSGSQLVSLDRYTQWKPGEPLVASCRHAGSRYEWTLVRGGKSLAKIREDGAASVYYGGGSVTTQASYWPTIPSVEPPDGYGYALSMITHDAPDESCSCGIYAAATENHEYATSGDVWGKVKLWGKVVPGATGMRAQFAYPSELHVPARLADDPAILAYGVPVFSEGTIAQIAAGRKPRFKVTPVRAVIAANLGACALNLSLAGFHVFH